MPKGPGTYGSKVGRPKKKKKMVGKKKRKVKSMEYRGKIQVGKKPKPKTIPRLTPKQKTLPPALQKKILAAKKRKKK
jgi:hypothetical protein